MTGKYNTMQFKIVDDLIKEKCNQKMCLFHKC